ncbi:MAG: F0F1 ATP synthase subunit epsilon [Gammaproteobacteria bacterium]|nr:F0F1 ATP synthase subunit epsilon [Gammaproteobacteria bacterium]
MHLQILLPYEVFTDVDDVQHIIVDTIEGSFGLQPKRLDCVAAVEAGILSYIADNGDLIHIAIDKGILVKVGNEVTVSVRQAKKDVDLEQLYTAIQTEFLIMDEREREIHSSLAKLESGFIRRMTGLQG